VGGTAAVVVATSDKDDKKGSKDAKADSTIAVHADSSVQIVSDRPDTSGHVVPVKPDTSLHMAPVKSDTVYIRDTVTVDKAVQHSGYKVVPDQHFDPILFEVNSAAIKQPDKKRLEDLAATVSQHQNWKLELTGMTDPSGSVSANRKVATARYSAVKNILLENGVKDSQIIVGSKLGDTNNMKPGENPRRVEIRIMDF
jgi:outer membrane protein OmpA-like peptidoglycan-associated protein